jgi:hypothetical protein
MRNEFDSPPRLTGPEVAQASAISEADRIEKLYELQQGRREEAQLELVRAAERQTAARNAKLQLIAKHEELERRLTRAFWQRCIAPVTVGVVLGILLVALFRKR